LLLNGIEHSLIANELELALEVTDLTAPFFDEMHKVEGRGGEGRIDRNGLIDLDAVLQILQLRSMPHLPLLQLLLCLLQTSLDIHIINIQ
jgi:hypothetical protein